MAFPSAPEQGSASNPTQDAVIIGAGPAGLTAALELSKSGVPCIVLESSAVPGGLAKTDEYKGYRFDIGGHRFFTKVRVVEQLWHELMGSDFLERRRLSRIYYRGKYFKYPLEPLDALRGLGLWNAAACGFSYLFARLFPVRPELTFNAWCRIGSGAGCSRSSLKAIRKKCGEFPVPRSAPNGRPNELKDWTPSASSKTCSSAIPRKRAKLSRR